MIIAQRLHLFSPHIFDRIDSKLAEGMPADHVLLAWDPKIGVKTYKVQISSTPDFRLSRSASWFSGAESSGRTTIASG